MITVHIMRRATPGLLCLCICLWAATAPSAEEQPIRFERVALALADTAALPDLLFGAGVEGIETVRPATTAAGGMVLWRQTRDEVDRRGNRHVYYQQEYVEDWYPPALVAALGTTGVPLRDSVLALHYGPDGTLQFASGGLYLDVPAVETLTIVSARQALILGLQDAAQQAAVVSGDPSHWPASTLEEMLASAALFLEPRDDGLAFRYVWELPVLDAQGNGAVVSVDGASGAVLEIRTSPVPGNCDPGPPNSPLVPVDAVAAPQNWSTIEARQDVGSVQDTTAPFPFSHDAFWVGVPATIPDISVYVRKAGASCLGREIELFPLIASCDPQYGCLPRYYPRLRSREGGLWCDINCTAGDAIWFTRLTMEALAGFGVCGIEGACADPLMEAVIVVNADCPYTDAMLYVHGIVSYAPPGSVAVCRRQQHALTPAAALDIVAHEWGHAFIFRLPNIFTYQDGRNSWKEQFHEGFADVVAHAVEWQQHTGSILPQIGVEKPDWIAGEDWDLGLCEIRRADAYDDRGGCVSTLTGATMKYSLHAEDPELPPGDPHAIGNRLSVVFMLLADGGPGQWNQPNPDGILPGQNPVCAAHPGYAGCYVPVPWIGIHDATELLFQLLRFHVPSIGVPPGEPDPDARAWQLLADEAKAAAFQLFSGPDSCDEQRAVIRAFQAIGHPPSTSDTIGDCPPMTQDPEDPPVDS